MPDRILLVDDDLSVLASLRRVLHGRYEVRCVGSGEMALQLAAEPPAFPAVIVDAHMPGMCGAVFLAHLAKISPSTVRIMLTGAADQATALEALDAGEVFRFLTKPCPSALLLAAIDAAVDQHRLLQEEQELLESTLVGAMKAITGLLAQVDRHTFGRLTAMRCLVHDAMTALGSPTNWEVEMAAGMAWIGVVTLPPAIRLKLRTGRALNDAEQRLVDGVPAVSARLLAHVPRLEPVAELVGLLSPEAMGRSGAIPMAGQVLRVAAAIDRLREEGHTMASAACQIAADPGRFEEAALVAVLQAATRGVGATPPSRQSLSVETDGLQIGDILQAPVLTPAGDVLVPAGRELNEPLLMRLLHSYHSGDLAGGIQIVRMIPSREEGP